MGGLALRASACSARFPTTILPVVLYRFAGAVPEGYRFDAEGQHPGAEVAR